MTADARVLAATSPGTLLDGRVTYAQRIEGYRTGIEPVLLAASIMARRGDRVVEAGTGAGAGLLCLAARVPGVAGLGLEIDPALAGLAASNLAANGHAAAPDGLRVLVQDVACWRASEVFDHAFANPPWHHADGTPSPVAGRRIAKIAGTTVLTAWTCALAAPLRRRGTLSLMLPASATAQGVGALQQAGCLEIDILPLWPRNGEAAKLVILRGTREGRGAGRILAGLTLHEADGRFTGAAEKVLRGGAGLG